METRRLFSELCGVLNAHKVEYVIVGGYALAHHGAPRMTGDIDILVKPENENAKRVLAALNDFGFGSLDLSVSDFTSPDVVVQLGLTPNRIDFMTSISGVGWEEIESGKDAGKFENVNVFYIGLNELIANKKASGRDRDLIDIKTLERTKMK